MKVAAMREQGGLAGENLPVASFAVRVRPHNLPGVLLGIAALRFHG